MAVGEREQGSWATAFRLGKVAGIPVYLDYSWFVIFFLLVWTIGFDLMPAAFPGLSQFYYLLTGAVTAILFFASLLVHELAHSIIAERNGLRIRRITLFLLGGVSELGDEPKDASLELKMAAAGPLTSAAIALVFGLVWVLSSTLDLSPLVQAPLFYLAFVNALMAGFNLIPAFPMDGGRMLRSLLWRRNGDVVRSTVAASSAGRTVASFTIFLGLFTMFLVDFVSGVWLVLIGWFISSSSTASFSQAVAAEELLGVRAADVMTRRVDSVPPEMTLQDLSEEFLRTKHTGFPVLSDGHLQGCVTMDDLRRSKRDSWAKKTVAEAMTPEARLITARLEDPAMDVLGALQRGDIGRVFVMDGDAVAGIITRSDVLKAIERREGALGIVRGGRAFDQKMSMTAETGMRFVLEQPTEHGFVWRAEYSGSGIELVNQEIAKSSAAQDVQRFTFQAIRVGVNVIRLQEVAGTPGKTGGPKKKALRTVTYTVEVGS
ncbi:MAG: site-2 protease family protein [Nitrososphaerota archaeon]|nr:site-2 protease family protein [Nitrososphaerota archaeon]MDG7023130.1 site-2 protease family protein [Nitrososphaerota archaeon]